MSDRTTNSPPLSLEQLLAIIAAHQQEQQQRDAGISTTSAAFNASAIQHVLAQASLARNRQNELRHRLQQQQAHQERVDRSQRIQHLCRSLMEANRQQRESNELLHVLLGKTNSSHSPQGQLMESLTLSMMQTRNSTPQPILSPPLVQAISLLFVQQQGQQQQREHQGQTTNLYGTDTTVSDSSSALHCSLPQNQQFRDSSTATAQDQQQLEQHHTSASNQQASNAKPSAGLTSPISPPHTSLPSTSKNESISFEQTDTRNAKKKQSEKFPKTLFRMLHDSAHNEIVRFAPSGAAFYILQTNAFANEVLPQYFHSARLSSFKRQLNLYGFRLLSHGPEAGAYVHETFHRDRQEASENIHRVK